MDTRYGQVEWGKGKPRRRTSAANWRLPIKWNREAADMDLQWKRKNFNPQQRTRVFCASLADWLDDEVPIEWLADLLKLIHDTPNLDWLMLTKRPENWSQRLEQVWNRSASEAASGIAYDWGRGTLVPSNIWFGTSVEDQKRADERIPELLKIPARVRFLSVEPMLSKIDLKLTKPVPLYDAEYGDQHEYQEVNRGISWCIFGGESGLGARPCAVEWIRDGIVQCQDAGVALFVKQLGSFATSNGMTVPGQHWPPQVKKLDVNFPDGLGWQHLLKDKKGGDPAEWPSDLRVREFPNVK